MTDFHYCHKNKIKLQNINKFWYNLAKQTYGRQVISTRNVLPLWSQAPLYLDWKRWIHFLSQKAHPVHRKGLLQISLCRQWIQLTSHFTKVKYCREYSLITVIKELPVNGVDGRWRSTWQTSTGVVIANWFNDAGHYSTHHTNHPGSGYSWNAPLNCKMF